jgi:transcriptional regulator with XRE-family HTH domain
MSTAEAILRLREKLGLNQRAFAQAIGVGARSLSRYESGYEPSAKILKKLADVAKKAGVHHLHDFFHAKRRADIVTRIESLPSAGSERRISVDELSKWLKDMRHLHTALKDLADRWKDLPDGEKLRKLKAELFPLEVVGNEIEVYLTGSTEALTGKGKWNV